MWAYLSTETTISVLQAILDGGISMLLLVALTIVGWLYFKEKESKEKTNNEHVKNLANLQKEFTKKVEELYKERLISETESAKVILRATEVMGSVVGALDRTNDTLDKLID